MPNAATFDDDLAYGQAPRRETRGGAPRKPRAPAAGGRKKKKGKRPRIDMHRVARYVAIGMASTMAIGIIVNALMLQKGHHPAPLFAQLPVVDAKPAASAKAASVQRVPDETGTRDLPATAPSRGTKAGTARGADTETSAASDDAIGRLIGGGGVGSPAKADALKSDGTDAHTVSTIQRALTKLGFKVPVTGTAGPTTRKAIEAYEKDRHLPVKGEVDRRFVKALAAEAKIKIE